MHLAFLIITWWSTVASALVVDRIEVVVDDQLVMTSEVQLEEVLATLDAAQSPFWAPNHKDALERLVDAAVIRQVSGDLKLYVPADEQVRQRVEDIRQQFANRGAWSDFLQRWGLDEVMLRTTIRRRMVVERYLARNVQSNPLQRNVWLADCDTLLLQLRERLRIRRPPPPKQ
ncbi:MAG: hypothetical protein HN348_19370 [Proteobacteria bacterium]|jgi:parvulin-like peptidyl-prolyl isomerase|nr:hypothetical protein [Pseudomonadota bacterium]